MFDDHSVIENEATELAGDKSPEELLKLVNERQTAKGDDGKRPYAEDGKYRLVTENLRQRAFGAERGQGSGGMPAQPKPAAPEGMPQTQFDKEHERLNALQGAVDPATGKRLYETSDNYRSNVERARAKLHAGESINDLLTNTEKQLAEPTYLTEVDVGGGVKVAAPEGYELEPTEIRAYWSEAQKHGITAEQFAAMVETHIRRSGE